MLLQLTTGITIYDDCYYNLRHVLQLTTLLQFTTDTLLWSVHLCSQSSISRANGDRSAFPDWEPRGRLCEKVICHKKVQQSFLNQSLDPPNKNSWIRLWLFSFFWRYYTYSPISFLFAFYILLSSTELICRPTTSVLEANCMQERIICERFLAQESFRK